MGKKKGEAETMEKFSELQYVRPDMEKVLGDMRAVTEALKNAADFVAPKTWFPPPGMGTRSPP